MKTTHTTHTLLAALALLGVHTASAHISYSGRDFGTFLADGNDALKTLNVTNLSSNFGWADAIDADFGDSHRTRAFRFTLTNPGLVTLSVTGGIGLLPGFSIYSGLAHVSPYALDHDTSAVSLAYLATLPGVAKEGAFNALADWKIGDDDTYNTSGVPASGVLYPASLSSLTFQGYAVDGTSANFGSVSGVSGDGTADGFVTGTFNLAAGDYSIFIGGADYSTQGPVTLGLNSTNGSAYSAYSFSASMSVVPEPASALLVGVSSLGLLTRRRRRA